MAKSKHEPVLFKNSLGETITNDPIYRAQQTLEQAGVEVDTSAAETDDSDDDVEEDEESPEDAEETTEEVDFDEMDGAALKAYAKDNDIDISGLKKVSEVRDAIRTASE